MRKVTTSLVSVTLVLSASLFIHASVNCRDCEPTFYDYSQPGGQYRISFEPGMFTSTEKRGILDGASQYWNAIFAETPDLGISVNGSEGQYGQTQIVFFKDDTLHGTNIIAQTHFVNQQGNANIGVNPDYMGDVRSYNYWGSTGAHEVGHAFDYRDVTIPGCDRTRTVMAQVIPDNVGFPSNVLCADESATMDKYYPGQYDYCQYGCPPGYTYDCQGDQLPDPSQCNCCFNHTPIIIDMAGHGFRMSSAEAGVLFPINELGSLVQEAWPETGTVWLARDINGNGRIDNGSELFGNTTRLSDGHFATNGYVALAEFDMNHDGYLDGKDSGYSLLQVWSDINRNGSTEDGELKSLDRAGVIRLDLRYHETHRQDRWGNRFRYLSNVLTSQGERHAADVYPVTVGNSICAKRGAVLSSEVPVR